MIFLPNPGGSAVYTVGFMCRDEHYREYCPKYATVVKGLRIGAIPPLKYTPEPPPGLVP